MRKRGFLVTLANSAESAFDLAKVDPPELAVVDLKMSGNSGLVLVIESAIRRISLLEIKAEKGDQAIIELGKIQRQEKESLIKPLKNAARRLFYLSSSLIYVFIPIGIFSYFMGLIVESDTKGVGNY